MRKEVRYLLHLWSDGEGVDSWRARVVELASHRERTFASLTALADYLVEQPHTQVGSESSDDS